MSLNLRVLPNGHFIIQTFTIVGSSRPQMINSDPWEMGNKCAPYVHSLLSAESVWLWPCVRAPRQCPAVSRKTGSNAGSSEVEPKQLKSPGKNTVKERERTLEFAMGSRLVLVKYWLLLSVIKFLSEPLEMVRGNHTRWSHKGRISPKSQSGRPKIPRILGGILKRVLSQKQGNTTCD